jgi:hypothetical protein
MSLFYVILSQKETKTSDLSYFDNTVLRLFIPCVKK